MSVFVQGCVLPKETALEGEVFLNEIMKTTKTIINR